MGAVITSIDFGQLTVEETYTKPIAALCFEIRSRLASEDERTDLMKLADEDIFIIQHADTADFMEDAADALEAWEDKAAGVGLCGYANEGMYWIEVMG